jgi:hypothetical protein
MQRSGQLTSVRRIVLCTLFCVFGACSVYQPELIGTNHGAMRSDAADDAGPLGDGAGAGGSGLSDAGSRGVIDDDAGSVAVPRTLCGDGRVSGDEKCDIGISEGSPGACPTKCPELAHCNPRALNNSGCQAECVLLQMVCMSGDGCCPGNCTADNDTDCSSRCGDGLVQEEYGETCEPESTTPCKRSDAECDDKDPCTVDKLIGNAKNCNALCTNVKIAAPKNGDGCCLNGSDANGDDDCKPICGNKVREAGEDCDGTTGCSASCVLSLQADQIACLEKFGNAGDECAKCSCMNCTATYLACRNNPDPNAVALCTGVLDCAQKNTCDGSACYCGDSLLCALPNGACRAEVEKAGNTTDPNTITSRAADPASPLGRASMADACRIQQCNAQCR